MITTVALYAAYRANLAKMQRTGQAFFNALPNALSAQLLDTAADPYEIATHEEMIAWQVEHLIYSDDGTEVVGLKNLNQRTQY